MAAVDRGVITPPADLHQVFDPHALLAAEPVDGARQLLDLAVARAAAARNGGGNNMEGAL